MSRIKYVSIHERDDGKRRIKAGKGDRSHNTLRMPAPGNDLEDFKRYEWERVAVFDLPEPMPKGEFTDWWNEHVHTDDEPDVINRVLREMGER